LKIPYYSVVKDRIKTPLVLKERSGIRTFKRSRHQGRPFTPGSEKLSYCWWSGPGLNRQPPACKADALPIELPPPIPLHSELDSPQTPIKVVGPGRVELPTLPLSGARSSQLSYGPSRFAGGLRLAGLSGDDALAASLSKPPAQRQFDRHSRAGNLTHTPMQAMYPVTIRCFQRPLPLAGRGLSKPNSSAGGGKKYLQLVRRPPVSFLAGLTGGLTSNG
jgi:hypothetical protein